MGILVVCRPFFMWAASRVPLAAWVFIGVRWLALLAVGLPFTALAAAVTLIDTAVWPLAAMVSVVELGAGRFIPQFRLWRLVWSTKRRWPVQYAVVDHTTADIQASFGGGASTFLSSGKRLPRPILRHPALWVVPRINWADMTATWVVFAPSGTTLLALERALPALTAAFPYIKRTDLDFHDPGASSGAIRFWYAPAPDPLAQPVGRVERVRGGEPVTSVAVGRRADGGPFTFPAPGHGLQHVLVSGKTGSGKSSTIAKILSGLASDENIAFLGVDHKGGLELAPWLPRFTVMSDNKDSTTRLLDRVNQLIDRRAHLIRQVAEDDGRTVREWRDDMGPRLVLLIDEGRELTYSKDAIEALDSIAARGRALGITVIIVTQYALAKDFPSTLLGNLGQRVCHRMGTMTQYAVALGVDQAELKEAGVEPIGEDQPGTCYVTGFPGVPEFARCRSDYVSDDDIDATVAAVAHLRFEERTIFG